MNFFYQFLLIIEVGVVHASEALSVECRGEFDEGLWQRFGIIDGILGRPCQWRLSMFRHVEPKDECPYMERWEKRSKEKIERVRVQY